MNNHEREQQDGPGPDSRNDYVARMVDQESFQALLFDSFLNQQKSKQKHLNDSHRLTAIVAVLRMLSDSSGQHHLLNSLAAKVLEITGATGVAIALLKDGAMGCCATSGATAPPLGARLSHDSGISGECVRTARTLICEDTETDGRVNREAAKQLGIRSMVVVPIVRKATAVGILEMFAAHPRAFDACDVRMAEVMAGLIQVWLGLRAERSVRQALEAERGSVLQVIEQITPTLEKVLLQQAHPEPAVRDASTAPPGTSGGAARVINTSVQALARSLAAYGFWKDDELPGFRGERTR